MQLTNTFMWKSLVDLSSFQLHVVFFAFLSTPSELHTSCLKHFSTSCQSRTPCCISGRFCPAKPKIKTNQPTLKNHTETTHPTHPTHHTREHPKHLENSLLELQPVFQLRISCMRPQCSVDRAVEPPKTGIRPCSCEGVAGLRWPATLLNLWFKLNTGKSG